MIVDILYPVIDVTTSRIPNIKKKPQSRFHATSRLEFTSYPASSFDCKPHPTSRQTYVGPSIQGYKKHKKQRPKILPCDYGVFCYNKLFRIIFCSFFINFLKEILWRPNRKLCNTREVTDSSKIKVPGFRGEARTPSGKKMCGCIVPFTGLSMGILDFVWN